MNSQDLCVAGARQTYVQPISMLDSTSEMNSRDLCVAGAGQTYVQPICMLDSTITA